jgi:hypothetical protein
MKKCFTVLFSCLALVALVLAAAPAAAETLKAEQLLEIYHRHSLPVTVAPPVKKLLKKVVTAVEEGDEAEALAIWKKLWERYPTEFSPVERARMKRWVVYRAYLTKGKPLRGVIVAWEQEHKSPSAQKQAIPELQQAINQQAHVIETMSAIMKNMHDTAKAVIRKMK